MKREWFLTICKPNPHPLCLKQSCRGRLLSVLPVKARLLSVLPFWGLQLHFQPIFRKFPCGLCFCTQCWSSLLLFTVASLLHSLLFPFLWIWPSDDVCVRAYITRTDGGGVWWVLWILVALTVFPPCLPSPCLFFYVFLNLCFSFKILCLNGTRFLPNWHKFLWLIAATYM